MSTVHTVRHQAEQFAGRVKESLGRATGNLRLERAGRRQRLSGSLKQTGRRLKDAFRL